MTKKTVFVIGTGTIGEPLIGLLARHKAELGFSDVLFHKRTPNVDEKGKLQMLVKEGAVMVSDADKAGEFRQQGLNPQLTTEKALEQADVVMDCSPSGNDNKGKLYAKYADGRRGFTAQGSEEGFGKRFAIGVNDKALDPKADRFVQIVSCNTHSITTMLHALAYENGADYDNLVEGSFVCIRRAIDVTQDAKYIPAPKVGKHDDEAYGTHHAHDAAGLFETLKVNPKIFSSAMQLNTQFMHTLHFNLKLKKATTKEQALKNIAANPHLATTTKKSSNLVFSFGRDYGPWGRLLMHSVIPTGSLAVIEGGTRAVGFSFTPQDGNPLISSLACATWFIDPTNYRAKLKPVMDKYLWKEV